jgi:hypothetical protein
VAQIVAKRNLRSARSADGGRAALADWSLAFFGRSATVAQKILFSVGHRLLRAEAHEKLSCRT